MIMIGFHTARNAGWNALSRNPTKIQSPILSKRGCAQNTAKKIEALCYVTGEEYPSSNFRYQNTEFFIPSRNFKLNENGIFPAEGPSNFISVRFDGMEEVEVKTPIFSIYVPENEVDELRKLYLEKLEISRKLSKLSDKHHDIKLSIENIFHDFLTRIDRNNPNS